MAKAVENRPVKNSRPMLTENRVQGIKKLISQSTMSAAVAMDPDVQAGIRFLQDLIARYYDPAATRQREKIRQATIQWRIDKQKNSSNKTSRKGR
jgi:hypothetical protein